ncbi:unnamed protein product [Prorocentrum cordatum]|uniref:Thiopurine S-methyltransferase n=1 Tax=Prorocentrum cordatum TaxID=2364126 RepID=A0ABN9Q9N2_9DINO|nr:unnamed protein product [Polarella glacialis]
MSGSLSAALATARGRAAALAAAGAAAGAAGAALAAPQPRRPARCYFEPRPDGSTDRLARWSGRTWGKIPWDRSPTFHLKGVHPLLEKYASRLVDGVSALDAEIGPSALVPLCGKSYDLLFLCQLGLGVVGVEGILRPICEFRSEHQGRVRGLRRSTPLHLRADGTWAEGADFQAADGFAGARPHRVFKSGPEGLGYYADFPAVWHGTVPAGVHGTRPLDLLQADFFEASPAMLAGGTFARRGACDVAVDRGGLDAVPPGARRQYVAALSRLLKPEGRVLLIVLEYDQSQVPVDPTGKRSRPPPFSVPEAEVRRLFPAGAWDVELLERRPETEISTFSPAFSGVTVREAAYLIHKRPGATPSTAARRAAGCAAVAGALAAAAWATRDARRGG